MFLKCNLKCNFHLRIVRFWIQENHFLLFVELIGIFYDVFMSITKLEINHLDKPFGVSPFDNSFSFISDEEGSFTVSIEQNNKVIEKKVVLFKGSISFYFDTPLEYGQKYTYKVSSSS